MKRHSPLDSLRRRQEQQSDQSKRPVDTFRGLSRPSDRALVPQVMPGEVASHEFNVPDVFDEERIRQDLAAVARGGFFRQYVARLRNRFTKSGEQAVMERWIRFYETGIQLVDAKTTFDRKAIENRQLGFQHEINTKKRDAEIAKLDADIEEHSLRKDTAAYKRHNIERFVEQVDEPERQMAAAHQRLKLDSRWKVYETLGTKLNTLAELQRWRKQQRAEIVRDRDLTPEEQEERLEYIDSLYDAQRTELKADGQIFAED